MEELRLEAPKPKTEDNSRKSENTTQQRGCEEIDFTIKDTTLTDEDHLWIMWGDK